MTEEEQPFIITDEYREKFKADLAQWYKDNPQEWSVFYLAKIIRRRLRKDWDLYYSLEGQAGVGKSCLSIIIGMLVDDNFQLDQNISYIPKGSELKDKFMAMRKYSYMQIDEAIRAMSRYKWQSKQQQEVMEMAATERFRNQCIAFLVPNFYSLARSLRERRLDIRVWVQARGDAIVYFKLNDKDSEDVWQIKSALEIKSKYWYRLKQRGKALMSMSTAARLKLEQRTPTYAFHFTFPDLKVLAPEIYKEYNRSKAVSRNAQKEEEAANEPQGYMGRRAERQMEQRNSLIVNLIDRHKIPLSEIAKMAQLAVTSIQTIYNEYRSRPQADDVTSTGAGLPLVKQVNNTLELKSQKDSPPGGEE